MAGKQWQSLASAAIALRLSDKQTLRLIFVGELTGKKEGRVWLVDSGSVRALAGRSVVT